ncbi:MAG: tyrosine-type recombinase/integrase, partial [Flavobacteriales bacterium]|nr:tyrosine-type recombinase/integrase [Flavobacteriales bacterium]
FLNQRGGRLSRVSVFKRLKQLVERAGIEKNISPHSIRHSFATHLVQNGADIRMVQVLLGHVSITSTEIYAHLEQKQLEDTMKRYHPQANR